MSYLIYIQTSHFEIEQRLTCLLSMINFILILLFASLDCFVMFFLTYLSTFLLLRVGQLRSCHVFKFIMRRSIEERIEATHAHMRSTVTSVHHKESLKVKDLLEYLRI